MVKRRNFDREFKLDILRQVEHKSLAEVCREHNLHPNLISRWKREQSDYPKTAFKGKGVLYKAEAQIAKLERLIGQLYAENALLKKAIMLSQEKQAEEKMMRCIK